MGEKEPVWEDEPVWGTGAFARPAKRSDTAFLFA
jgi:hypothetical protein